jgi:hypothetical protein
MKQNLTLPKEVDSSLVSATGIGERLIIFMPTNKKHEYKFTFAAIGKTYTLGDFIIKREICNCPGDYYDALRGYTLNGEKISGSARVIIKNK